MPTEPSENPGQLPDLDLRRRVAQSQGVVNIQEDRLGQLYGRWPGGDYVSIPAYELDIAAAWGLLDGLVYEINNRLHGRVYVTIYGASGAAAMRYATTAPLAICRAYLAYREASDAK